MVIALPVFSQSEITGKVAPEKEWPVECKKVEIVSTADYTVQPAIFFGAKSNQPRPLVVRLHAWSSDYSKAGKNIELPERGLCAHRGAMETHPENTIPAFRAAVEAGAHMIEFDVWLTADNQMVVIHDPTVDRTTNGKGKVSDLTFSEIRKLDAGSRKSAEFAGVQIPTPEEVMNEMPHNMWINIHIKGEGELPVMLARLVEAQGRLHQVFLACSAEAARLAKEAVPGIKICNMERRGSVQEYVDETIRLKADFIQLLKNSDYTDFAGSVKQLKENGVRVNYFGTDSPEELKMLFETGVNFPLVNNIIHTIDVAKNLGIEPLKPVYRTK